MSDENKVLVRIRNRASYKRFGELFDKFKVLGLTKKKVAEALNIMHSEIDRRNGFGSETHSYWADESIKQLCQDRGVVC